MPPRPSFQTLSRRARPSASRVILPFRAQQPARLASAKPDPQLHPNPAASPSTEPQSPAPSANHARTDNPDDGQHGYGPGHASPAAQSNLDPKGPNMEQAPHVSEEAAAMSKSMGESGPDISQGTPVQEVLKREGGEGAEKLPKVMRENVGQQKRSFHTATRRRADLEQFSTEEPAPPPSMDVTVAKQRVPSREQQDYPGQYHEITEAEALLIARGEAPDPMRMRKVAQARAQERQGLKFEAPRTPSGMQKHLHARYDGVVEQVTNMIMRDGKKSVAQKNIAEILTFLRTHPSPTASPAGTPRRLLPLPQHTSTQDKLPLHPVFYLTHAIDSIAPLMRIRSQRGLAGGGIALQIPQPLNLRQRRRTAIVWILEACDRRKGGTSHFAKRFAEEVVAIVEGRSSVWGKRENLHRMAVMGRSNLNMVRGGRR